ncbi:uncharacterized protein METZ01_LOCUS155038 [marine metagenome]|uniref:Alkyl hydroperoxide reductase subunit C/ Thiol specific antioxidant domain-containing protein n=1 Tax=marine metagenome TaxID=408172 RepID=A0A382ALD5_9ZZZZ
MMNFISPWWDFQCRLKSSPIILIALALSLSIACNNNFDEQSHTTDLDDNSSSSATIHNEKVESPTQSATSISKKAPDFSLPSIQGQTFTRSDFEGDKTVLLVFYRAFW